MEIRTDARLFPYFKDCIGAIDGTYVPAHVPASKHRTYRDRKGNISQNIMAACSFDMKFTYILAGWEGSAGDSQVLRNALNRQNKLSLPEGKYYLVDSGYVNTKGFLNPYQGTRYHLKDFRGSGREPATVNELFNHRHSSLRNVIERAFGVLKARFTILRVQPEFLLRTQSMIIVACCLIHNHILIEKAAVVGSDSDSDGDIDLNRIQEEIDARSSTDNVEHVEPLGTESLLSQRAEDIQWARFQDDTTRLLWNDYVGGS